MNPVKTKTISAVIPDLLRSIETAYPNAGHRIWEVWAEAVGPELARRTKPLDFKAGKLTVGVDGASWLQQFVFISPQIVEAVNARLPKPLVKTIKPVAAHVEPVEDRPAPQLLREGPLLPEEIELLDAAREGIADEELALAVMKAREASLRRATPPRSPEEGQPPSNTSSDSPDRRAK